MRHEHPTEGRPFAVIVAVILAVGIASSVVGIPSYLAAAGLLVAGLGWLAVGMVRRERRIRARLIDPRIVHHPGRVSCGPVLSSPTAGCERRAA